MPQPGLSAARRRKRSDSIVQATRRETFSCSAGPLQAPALLLICSCTCLHLYIYNLPRDPETFGWSPMRGLTESPVSYVHACSAGDEDARPVTAADSGGRCFVPFCGAKDEYHQTVPNTRYSACVFAGAHALAPPPPCRAACCLLSLASRTEIAPR